MAPKKQKMALGAFLADESALPMLHKILGGIVD